MKGKITQWDDKKGYGFISISNSQTHLFVHISDIKKSSFLNGNIRPNENDEVRFEVEEDNKGRQNAVNVKITSHKSLPFTVLFSLVFLTFVAGVLLVNHHSFYIVIWYVGLSLVTYIMFAYDKKSATIGRWRTPEKTLHIVSLIGGWPGALIAQNLLRHKSKKRSFRVTLWLMILINITVFTWIFVLSDFNVVLS